MDGQQVALPDAPTVAEEPSDRVHLVAPTVPDDERYRVERELGRGGMGAVELVRDRRIGRSIARKVMHGQGAADAAARARFVREVQVQGQLEHPAIVPVYDLDGGDGERPSFTMKRVLGRTLAAIIAELRGGAHARYTRHKLLTAFGGVCLAIDYAHQRGVVHRDLKPANVMLGDFGEFYVLDWGIAKLTGPGAEAEPEAAREGAVDAAAVETAHGALMGTPGYIAPEVLHGETASCASDVYALGAILFEVLVLEPLIPRAPLAAMIAAAAHGDRGDLLARCAARDIPPELIAICERATATSPAARYPSARELHDAVEGVLAGERDGALRHALSVRRCAEARREVEPALAGGLDALAHRRRALAAVNQALAYDPENREAMDLLARIVTTPPAITPPEVEVELARQHHRGSRAIAKLGVWVYVAILGFFPVLAWMGIREPLMVAAMFLCMVVPAALSVIVARSRRQPTGLVLWSAAISTTGLALASTLFGPFVMVPAAIAVNSTAYAFFVDRRTRPVIAVIATLGLLVPIALELAGVHASYRFADGGLAIVPRAVTMSAAPTFALLGVVSLTSIVLGTVIVGMLRDRVLEAERRVMLYAWHLREFVPPDAREATDPVA